jgi:hypothetical protein
MIIHINILQYIYINVDDRDPDPTSGYCRDRKGRKDARCIVDADTDTEGRIRKGQLRRKFFQEQLAGSRQGDRTGP